jgi:hypothetical protein
LTEVFFSGCCNIFPSGGYAENTLNHVLNEVFPAVDASLSDETDGLSSLTDDRDRTMLFGYSLGGLMACHALWTRPEVISADRSRFEKQSGKCFYSQITMHILVTKSIWQCSKLC